MSSHAKPDWVPLAISRRVNMNADHPMGLKVGCEQSFTLNLGAHGTTNGLLHSVRYSAPPSFAAEPDMLGILTTASHPHLASLTLME